MRRTRHPSQAPVVALTVVLLASGCAGRYEPVVDTQYIDPVQYETDLAECRQYAERVSPATDAAVSGGIGAAIGAAAGAALGWVFGSPGTGAAVGGIAGGSSGAVGGASGGIERQERIIRNCLSGRGYNVLD